jgi:methylmalonyl-CoA mutase
MMATDTFLSDFPPVTTEAWEAAIRDDLKGADYAKLLWRAEDGLELKPYYRADDLAGLSSANTAPGEFQCMRGAPKARWRIREQIESTDPEQANLEARNAIAAGAEEIAFAGAKAESASDLTVLLAGLDEIPIHFSDLNETAMRLVTERMRKRPHEAIISAALDPLADPEVSAALLSSRPSSLIPFTITAQEFHERGASSAEQVGFALAAGVDFIAEMQERGMPADRVADSITFSFAIGPEFFIQIGKLRAFRMLWARVVENFGVSDEHAAARIHACTSRWNRTSDAPHMNILRGTTEAMAAVLGGADCISVVPFDESRQSPGELGRRLARNTQIILKHEASLGRVADPAGGSYAVEVITDTIAAQAWKIMQEIEAHGGYRRASAIIAHTLEERSGTNRTVGTEN